MKKTESFETQQENLVGRIKNYLEEFNLDDACVQEERDNEVSVCVNLPKEYVGALIKDIQSCVSGLELSCNTKFFKEKLFSFIKKIKSQHDLELEFDPSGRTLNDIVENEERWFLIRRK